MVSDVSDDVFDDMGLRWAGFEGGRLPQVTFNENPPEVLNDSGVLCPATLPDYFARGRTFRRRYPTDPVWCWR